MNILSIETSCDETCAAVVKDGREVLSNIVASQIETHRIYGGVVPEIASRQHIEVIYDVTDRALKEAGLNMKDIEAIAVTAWPGLIGALLVGVNFAKGLSLANNKPLIPVHHIKSHIAANYIQFKELEPPFLCLIVSGGHSNLVEVLDYTTYRVLGKTRDDAAGECFDKVARVMGLPYPGGVEISKLALKGNQDRYHFPNPSIEGEPLNFSFSGLKTAAINMLHNAGQKGEEINIEDFAASFNKAVVEALTSRLQIAIRQTGYKKVALAGGVSANKMLRDKVSEICSEEGCSLYMPPHYLCGDNAAMVGAQGYYEYLNGVICDLSLNAQAVKSMEK